MAAVYACFGSIGAIPGGNGRTVTSLPMVVVLRSESHVDDGFDGGAGVEGDGDTDAGDRGVDGRMTFWDVVGGSDVFNVDAGDHGVGGRVTFWDVVGSSVIEIARDSHVDDGVDGDAGVLKRTCPRLKSNTKSPLVTDRAVCSPPAEINSLKFVAREYSR